jgi:Flp pilus assembly protein TadD
MTNVRGNSPSRRQPRAGAAKKPEVRSEHVEQPEIIVDRSAIADRVQKSIMSIRAAGLSSIPNAKSRAMVTNDSRSLQQIRSYSRQDLYAIAEIGYHYLFSGGVEIARGLFEGLAQVAPDEAYFAMALGLCSDHQGMPEEAERWYARASQLDPHDGRADVNRAELCVERKDFNSARALLSRGAKKARLRQDVALERKAVALYRHIERA